MPTHQANSSAVVTVASWEEIFTSGRKSPHDDFADLNHRRLVGVVRNISHDLFRVRSEACLERRHGIAENVAHADVGRRGARSTARKALVDGVVLAAIAHPALD